MGGATCCVINCKNTAVNSKCTFYRFPQTSYKLEQRTRWIAAVKRISTDGSSWSPGPNDLICSAHFVGNKKSEEQASPSYVPSIFPTVYKSRKVDEEAAENRHDRFIKRRFKKKEESVVEAPVLSVDQMELDTDYVVNEMTVESETEKKCIDQECQVNIFLEENVLNDNTLVCNRYIFNGSSVGDAETQTDINKGKIDVKIIKEKVYKDKKCGTVEKIFVDKAVGLDFKIENNHTNKKHFNGYESIKNNEQLIDLAGVSVNNFNFLLKRITAADRCVISKEDRLLIFLTKIKTGLTFSAMSVFFAVHRTTISKIFYSTLQQLAGATAELVFWPDKNTVQETMPACFHPNYTKTRVIIDCTEFKIEITASVDNRVYTYSHYKKGFTAKLLVGITPSGFISLVSKVAGGRKSDSQMTIESGLIDLLDDGDVVLADKGFPDIQKTIDQSGKAVLLVMPPFLGKKSEFTKEETADTYNIARVRIHVERIMQRLRTYNILNKIPEHLFNHIDDIVHICCVLVNLQPPIISDVKEKQEKYVY